MENISVFKRIEEVVKYFEDISNNTLNKLKETKDSLTQKINSITPASIGAANLKGDIFTGPITINSNINGSYNEGLRISRAGNSWAGITFGSNGTSGAPIDGWFAATNPQNQFIISPDDSDNTNGLTLNKNGNLLWRNTAVSLATHTHNYAGSASVGGAANSANKLNTDAGSANIPVYFKNGIPVACGGENGSSSSDNLQFGILRYYTYSCTIYTYMHKYGYGPYNSSTGYEYYFSNAYNSTSGGTTNKIITFPGAFSHIIGACAYIQKNGCYIGLSNSSNITTSNITLTTPQIFCDSNYATQYINAGGGGWSNAYAYTFYEIPVTILVYGI